MGGDAGGGGDADGADLVWVRFKVWVRGKGVTGLGWEDEDWKKEGKGDEKPRKGWGLASHVYSRHTKALSL